MTPSVHEYIYQGEPERLAAIYGLLDAARSPRVGAVFAVASLCAFAALWLRTRDVDRHGGHHALPLVSGLLMLAASYCLTLGYVDEVAVNLEHPYNLWHHGRFSFSPARAVDGTVEFAYYLLLTPFAWSQQSLIAANATLGFVLAAAHVVLLARLLTGVPALARCGLLLLFATYHPLIRHFSSGFGAGLVSLFVMTAICLHLRQRSTAALIVAACLPLLRPDAVVYSFALILAMSPWRPWALRSMAMWAGAALAAVALYLALHRAAYGHWIPTPIEFKSVTPAGLLMARPGQFVRNVFEAIGSPQQAAALVAIAATVGLTDARLRVVHRLLLPMSAIFAFYALVNTILADFSGGTHSRYWAGFDLTLILGLVFALAFAARELATRPADFAIVFRRIVPLLVVVGLAGAWTSTRVLRNRNELGIAGHFVDRLLPPAFSLATSELNTFGFVMPNREIIDLWGYTNPAIAQSSVLSARRIRGDARYFLRARPDVFWAYEPLRGSSDVEAYLSQFVHTSRHGNNILGNLHDVMAEYDAVIVRRPEIEFLMLVRRARMAALDESAASLGYRRAPPRAFDRERFGRLYDAQPIIEHAF